MATISRLLKIIGLFCKRALLKRRYSAKETCNFKEPTNRSHPIISCIEREREYESLALVLLYVEREREYESIYESMRARARVRDRESARTK